MLAAGDDSMEASSGVDSGVWSVVAIDGDWADAGAVPGPGVIRTRYGPMRSATAPPSSSLAHYNLGLELFHRGRLQGAVDHYRRVAAQPARRCGTP